MPCPAAPQIFSKVVTAAAVAVTGDPNEFDKIAHSVRAATWNHTLVVYGLCVCFRVEVLM